MPSSYLPHRLVHAHLPAPPLIPNAIPELRITTERPYPETSDVYDEPLHRDHAVSVAFDPTTGILARVIHNGYCLELRNLNTVIDPHHQRPSIGSETLRVFFPDPLRPLAERCIVFSRRTGLLFVLAVTQANCLYRLSFPLGSYTARLGDRFVFTTKGNEDWCEEWGVPDDTVVSCAGVGAWMVVNESSVVLGGGDGGIVRLIRTSRGAGEVSFQSNMRDH